MKIENYKNKDILLAREELVAIPVNTVGVMGKGLARQFKEKFPDDFLTYKHLCDKKELRIKEFAIIQKQNNFDVLLFPTKQHWRALSKIEDIEATLRELRPVLHKKQYHSVAFPRIGCGLGGLDWNKVRPLIELYLKDIVDLYFYE